MKTYHAYSSKETQTLGAVIAEKVVHVGSGHSAKVVSLWGSLGAGKTTFVQGFLRSLGVRGKITSPTFVLMKKFSLPSSLARKHGFTVAYHIDAYRFHDQAESDTLGLKKILKEAGAIVIVEWPERLGSSLPSRHMKIKFEYGRAENERVIIAP